MYAILSLFLNTKNVPRVQTHHIADSKKSKTLNAEKHVFENLLQHFTKNKKSMLQTNYFRKQHRTNKSKT